MDFVIYGLAFVGAAVLIIGAGAWLTMWVDNLAASLVASRRSLVIEETEERLLSRLASDAYWFSEDVPTMRLLCGLAKGGNVSSLRDKWREDRTAAYAPAAVQPTSGVALVAAPHEVIR